MNEITQMIIEYASMWAPALGAIVGVAVTVITGLNSVKRTVNDFRSDKTLSELRTELSEQNQRLSELVTDYKELSRENRLIIDKVYHINGYVEAKKREERQKRYDQISNKEV